MAKIEFDIDNVAKLARLDLTEEDRIALEKDLPSILEYIGKLQEVDTSKVEAKEYLNDIENVFREDEVSMDEDIRQDILKGFPKKTGDALEVPAVFE